MKIQTGAAASAGYFCLTTVKTGVKSGPAADAAAERCSRRGPAGSAYNAFVDAFSKMHQAMALNFTCHANVDFVHGMIAHHEGEVAMCDALLNSEAAVDAELRALCVNLTQQQTQEVELLEAWLLTQGHPSHASGHNHWCDHQPPPRCVAPTRSVARSRCSRTCTRSTHL